MEVHLKRYFLIRIQFEFEEWCLCHLQELPKYSGQGKDSQIWPTGLPVGNPRGWAPCKRQSVRMEVICLWKILARLDCHWLVTWSCVPKITIAWLVFHPSLLVHLWAKCLEQPVHLWVPCLSTPVHLWAQYPTVHLLAANHEPPVKTVNNSLVSHMPIHSKYQLASCHEDEDDEDLK